MALVYGSKEYFKGFKYPGKGGTLKQKEDDPILFTQPPDTERVYKEYDGGCCKGDEETFYILSDGRMHGPYMWEYGKQEWFWFWQGKPVSKEEYVNLFRGSKL